MSSELAAAKRQLRRAMAERRRAVNPDVARAAARAVADHLLADARVRAAARVALYAALPDELPTRPLFEALGALGKTRLLPRIRSGEMEFAAVESWEELRSGVFDVLEPPGSRPPVGLAAEDVVVVPGVAFDACGQRLGRGKAYYDRAFAGARRALPLLIGTGFEAQIVPAVPHDSRDRSMDAIVTERGLRWIPRDT
jgi:5-formyltetrahydrofolate cyclo-ligase